MHSHTRKDMAVFRLRRVWLAIWTAVLVVTFSFLTTASAKELRCFGVRATIVGSADRDEQDKLNGTPGSDVIVARRGHDIVMGRGGNDLICGGGGVDRIHAGPGNDKIRGGNRADYIAGNAGDDFLDGLRGNDRLFGDSMPASVESYISGPFDETQIGDDILRGGSFHDLVDGGPGHDRMYGGQDSDTVSFYTSPAAVSSDPSTGVVTGEVTEHFWNFEALEGSRFADELEGWPGHWVGGHPGDDTLTGTSSGESLDGGSGDDTVTGKGGRDSLWGEYLVVGHGGNDRLSGGNGHDLIVGDLGADELRGGTGDDFVDASVFSGVDAGTDEPDVVIDAGDDTDRCFLDANDPDPVRCETVRR
jgi:Ca2+-binding RTX toxin-like protein